VTAPQLANRFAQVLIDTAIAHGFDVKTIYKASGIPPRGQRPGAVSYSSDELAKLSRHIKLLLQDEFCGLTATGCKIGSFEFMCELATAGPTLADSLHKAFRFYAILSDDIRFSLHTQENNTFIQVQLTAPELDRYNFLSEWWPFVWWGVASWLIGENIHCLGFEFPHAPAVAIEDYNEAFPGPCKFAQPAVRFYFDKRYLDKPVVRSASEVSSFIIVRNLDFGVVPGVTSQIKQRLHHRLKNIFQSSKQFPPMEDIAKEFCLSSQTLRRRLEEEETSYRQLKEDIRRDVVVKFLKMPNVSIAEITLQGGFSDASALARAVKGWTGLYPKQYRELLGHENLH